ncbi:MAG TPA: Ku protein [Polyangiaceae bacterium]|nr:Ku protein [Polyangiaceae bacterium]
MCRTILDVAARAISSGTISFGLVSIPVKLYTAASSEQVSFNMLHTKCKGRIKMQYFCPTDNEVVERSDTLKGYEYAKGQYVLFTEEELKALEAARDNSIEITEFVPLSSVDLVQVEKSYYLGPDKGGDKAYRLLSEAMDGKDRVAVGRWAARGKEQLVLVRPHGDGGLILHQLYYANEVRSFEDIETGAKFSFSDKERELADKLIEQLSSEAFEAEKYHDSYSDRVLAAVDQRVQGQEVTVAPEAPKAQIIDLFEALKKSLENAPKPFEPGTGAIKPPKKAPAKPKSEGKKTKASG